MAFRLGPNKQNQRRQAMAITAGDHMKSRRLLTTLVNTRTLTYQDIDSDIVTVKFPKPILTSQTTANTIFTFSTGFPGVTGSGMHSSSSCSASTLLRSPLPREQPSQPRQSEVR